MLYFSAIEISEYLLGNKWNKRSISRFLKGKACVDCFNNITILKYLKELKYGLTESYFICDDGNLKFVIMKVNMVKKIPLLNRILLFMVIHFFYYNAIVANF